MKFKNVFLGLAVMLAVSCGSKEEKKETEAIVPTETTVEAPVAKDAAVAIVKSWTLEDMDASAAEADVPEKDRAEFKKMLGEMVSKMKTKTVYTFEEGGKIKTTTMDYENKWKDEEGTWSLAEDKKTLTITTHGKADKFDIINISDNNLDMHSDEAKMTLKFVPKQ